MFVRGPFVTRPLGGRNWPCRAIAAMPVGSGGAPAHAFIRIDQDRCRKTERSDAGRDLLNLLLRVGACVAGMGSYLVDGYDHVSIRQDMPPLPEHARQTRHASRQSSCSDGIIAARCRCAIVAHRSHCALPAHVSHKETVSTASRLHRRLGHQISGFRTSSRHRNFGHLARGIMPV